MEGEKDHLCEMRFNPCDIRLNIRKLEKLTKLEILNCMRFFQVIGCLFQSNVNIFFRSS